MIFVLHLSIPVGINPMETNEALNYSRLIESSPPINSITKEQPCPEVPHMSKSGIDVSWALPRTYTHLIKHNN
jgi:hypothetical protein